MFSTLHHELANADIAERLRQAEAYRLANLATEIEPQGAGGAIRWPRLRKNRARLGRAVRAPGTAVKRWVPLPGLHAEE